MCNLLQIMRREDWPLLVSVTTSHFLDILVLAAVTEDARSLPKALHTFSGLVLGTGVLGGACLICCFLIGCDVIAVCVKGSSGL